jgi:hypothetical protein
MGDAGMTGTFAPAPRKGVCNFRECEAVINPGEVIYLFKDSIPVCLSCAKTRWGYVPADAPVMVDSSTSRLALGFDSTRSILKNLQRKANQDDPKMRQAGER